MRSLINRFANSASAGFRSVLLITGTAGFLLGAIVFPNWQHAVEGAQITAGLVKYTSPSPFYWYQANLWTLSHQLPALLMWLGFTEKVLSIIISGLLGMISFQAIGLSALAFSGDVSLGIMMPFFIHFTRSVNFGVVYSIELMGSLATYGILGLGYVLLTLALISLKKNRPGYFMLGLAPSVHPSLGLFILAVVSGVILIDRFFGSRRFRVSWKFLCLGFFVSAISFIWHLEMAKILPDVHAREAAPYVDMFIRNWCGHRRPVPPEDPGYILHGAATAFMLAFLLLRRRSLSEECLFLTLSSVVSGILAVSGAFLTWLPAERLPLPLLALMPGRYLSLTIFLTPIFLLSVFSLDKADTKKQGVWVLLILSLYLLVRHQQVHPEWTVFVIILAGCALLTLELGRRSKHVFPARIFHGFGKFILLLAMLKVILISIFFMDTWRLEFYRDADGPFWKSVSKDSGMLLTTDDLAEVQLRSRRPVLLEVAAVDGLPYAPQSGPYMNAILNELYCADLLRSPTGEGSLVDYDQCVPLWGSRTREDWKRLALKYGFTQILTSSGWKVNLPIKAQNDKYTLYDL